MPGSRSWSLARGPIASLRQSGMCFTGVSKDHHDWEQGLDEAVHYLVALVPMGSLVIDPYMGSATCGVAALHCGMRFQGCEIDAETFQHAQRRLAQEQKTPRQTKS